MAHILKSLIIASEKAANVARSCINSTSDSLLTIEKEASEANTRFDKDFKTIADVLAQESAKAYIVKDFPELFEDLRGEENASIGGVTISLQSTSEKTAELLKQLVPSESATKMARAAHCDVDFNISNKVPKHLPAINPDELGVWIDPIDGTAEFIAGVKGDTDASKRLLCVTVLIGAYLKTSGEPVVGVINQPFYNDGKGRIIWGISYNGTNIWSENKTITSDEKSILLSGSEKQEIIKKFKNAGWKVQSVAGAGNKLMMVALGEASAYLVSQGTTFSWDTCGPHSVIRSKGGDVINFEDFVPLLYNKKKDLDSVEYANKDGIIAFTNEIILNQIKEIISNC